MVATRAALRYAGGKWLIAPWIISHFPSHDAYVEPFGGGASVLLQKREATVETYNDIDGDVVAFFRMLRDHPDELVRAIELTPFARDEFGMAYVTATTPMEQARRLYIRSWQARGMGKTAVAAGWRMVRKESRWRAPSKEWTTLDHLYAIADRLRGVQIEHDDASAVLRRYDGLRVLAYVDPPYVPSTLGGGQRTVDVYAAGMDEAGHRDLAAILAAFKGFVVLSGYPGPLYAELYETAGWHRVEHMAQVNHPDTQRSEALWLSPRTVVALSQGGWGITAPLFP